jgi:hypothetical protein
MVRSSRSNRMRGAFKVIAILAVLALLAAGVTFFVLDKPGSDGARHKWGKAEAEMGEIQKALNSHWLEAKEYPDSLDTLTKEYFKNGVPKNPYTKEHYDFVSKGDRFFLVCYGRDEKPGGAEPPDADIVYSEQGRLTR